MKILFVSILTATLLSATEAVACDKPVADRRVNAPVSLMLDANVDAAEIYLDGKFIGTTPVGYELQPGEHALEFRKEGFENWSRKLHVAQRGNTRVKATMKNIAQR